MFFSIPIIQYVYVNVVSTTNGCNHLCFMLYWHVFIGKLKEKQSSKEYDKHWTVSFAGTKHYFNTYNEKHNFIEAYYDYCDKFINCFLNNLLKCVLNRFPLSREK